MRAQDDNEHGRPMTISTLAELVAPLSEDAFRERLRTRTIALQQSMGSQRLNGLPDWTALRGLLRSGKLKPGDFRVRARDELVPELFYFAKGDARPDAVESLLDKNASVIFRHLERHFPALDALCRDIASRTGERCFVDGIVQTGPGGALGFHYDVEDMLVLQVEGSKRWRIHDTALAHPVVTGPVDGAAAGTALFDDVLTPGDTLLVPAGFTHHCDNGPGSRPGRSLHLSVCLVPDTGYYAVKALLPALAEDPLFRQPLSRERDPTARAELEAQLRQRLADALGRASWRDPDDSKDKY